MSHFDSLQCAGHPKLQADPQYPSGHQVQKPKSSQNLQVVKQPKFYTIMQFEGALF